jgi:twitching motility protein PilT
MNAPIPGIDVIERAASQHSLIADALELLMHFEDSLTDVIVHEGSPIMVKSAAGTLPVHQLVPNFPDVAVELADIKHFIATSLDGHPEERAPSEHWERTVAPTLAARETINRRLVHSGGRCARVNIFQYQGEKVGLVLRITAREITPLASLQLPHSLVTLVTEASDGFLVITGPTASGKSATARSILDYYNRNRSGHVVTIEDPIEMALPDIKCLFSQREVGLDVNGFGQGMKEALRQSPDIVMTGEIRDEDTAEASLLMGESGSLVLATTHGRSATGTLRKILSLTGARSGAMSQVLAGSLLAVVRQALVPSLDGKRYHLACDVLFNTGRVGGFIERGDFAGLEQAIRDDSLATNEFISMNLRIADLVKKGLVSGDAGLRASTSPSALKKRLA